MSIKAKIIIDNTEINVAQFSFGFNQKADDNGRPFQKPVFVGLQLVIETRKDLNLADWAFASYKAKQLELHIYPAIMGGKTRKIYFYDCHLVNWNNHFLATGNYPMSETLHITAAGVKNSYSNTEYSAYWRETFPQQKIEPTVQEEDKEKKTPKILNGWWSKDQFNNQKLKEAKLGDTVYFILETKDIDDGEKITLKLYEQDKNIFMRDFLDPDDDEFPEEEVVKKVTVHNNQATVELKLQESWEPMIVDDTDNAFSLDEQLELYWKVSYNDISKELPNKDNDYLRVSFSDRTLYFKTPTPNHNLPEFISYNGDPMLLMEFSKGFVKSKIQEKALDIATKKANAQIKKIAFSKLKKGYMVDSNGKVYTGQRLIYEYKKMYSNDGELFENVQKGKDFGYNHNKVVNTTKGISQYDYFSKNGKRVTLLGMVKNMGNIFDIFNLVKSAGEDLDTSQPLPLDFGPLSPIADLAGVLVQEQKAEMDAWLEESVQLEVDEAKLKGLEATRKAINSWNHNDEFKWELMAISKETANKLIQGEFKTFEEFRDYNIDNRREDERIYILYRKIENINRDKFVYIIETIFIDE